MGVNREFANNRKLQGSPFKENSCLALSTISSSIFWHLGVRLSWLFVPSSSRLVNSRRARRCGLWSKIKSGTQNVRLLSSKGTHLVTLAHFQDCEKKFQNVINSLHYVISSSFQQRICWLTVPLFFYFPMQFGLFDGWFTID